MNKLNAQKGDLRKHGLSTQLIVLFHSFRGGPEKMSDVCKYIAQLYPDADQYVPNLPCSTFSQASPGDIAARQLAKIDGIWSDGSANYRSIMFVGHSIGALIARSTVLLAIERAGAVDGDQTLDWVNRVDRLVLLAGLNRGWKAGHHLSLFNQLNWNVGTAIGSVWGAITKKPFLIMSIRRGSPYLTDLRIRWILAANQAQRQGGAFPLTIQMLGSADDMVSPKDNIDLVSGRNFYYLDVPYSDHRSVVDLQSANIVQSAYRPKTTDGAERKRVLRAALMSTKDELESITHLPADKPQDPPNHDTTDFVFVIHGIRDVGHWTQKIARAILRRSRQGAIDGKTVQMAAETSSYGFFPMLPFFLPWARRQKVEWLMDQYAEALAEHPNAQMSFVGHSNGTYLLARALQDYPFCRFKNVVLAGSVIRSSYNWEERRKTNQVQNVLNFVATSDWVVAIFPKAAEMLSVQDLGSGGHDGFGGKINEIRYMKGQHSAALVEENWDSIAEFVVTGDLPLLPPTRTDQDQSEGLARWAKFAPLIWVAAIAALVSLGFGVRALGSTETARTLLVVVYLSAIWGVITRL